MGRLMTKISSSGPLVTVIAVGYNHAAFVGRALTSIAEQSVPFVLRIVDDASSDCTASFVRRWLQDHAEVQGVFDEHSVNLGITQTFQRALEQVQTPYVTFVSLDDAWEPDLLERLITRLQDEPAAAVAYADARIIDELGTEISGSFLQAEGQDPQHPPSGRIYCDLLRGNWIPAMATVIRRQMLMDIGGYDTRLTYEDWDVWLRLARRHQIVYVGGGPLARYRVLPNSLIRRPIDYHAGSTALLLSKHLESAHVRATVISLTSGLVMRGDRRALRPLVEMARHDRHPFGVLLLLLRCCHHGVREWANGRR